MSEQPPTAPPQPRRDVDVLDEANRAMIDQLQWVINLTDETNRLLKQVNSRLFVIEMAALPFAVASVLMLMLLFGFIVMNLK